MGKKVNDYVTDLQAGIEELNNANPKTPEEQHRIRENFRRYQDMKRERRELLRDRYRNMSLEERRELREPTATATVTATP